MLVAGGVDVAEVKPRTKPGDKTMQKQQLKEKLKKEAPGVLGWLVEGALEWQKQGLNPPPKIISAAVRGKDSSLFYAFALQRLVPKKGAAVSANDLYSEFVEWWRATVGPLIAPQKQAFKKQMRKFLKWRKTARAGEWYQGIVINPEDYPERSSVL